MDDNSNSADQLGQLIVDNLNRNVMARCQQRDIEAALKASGVRYMHGGVSAHDLVLNLPDYGLAIGVNRAQRPGKDDLLPPTENMIVVQGEQAAQALASLIRTGRMELPVN